MITVNITISGNTDVLNRLKRFEGDLNDWHDTFNDVGDYLMDVYSRLSFETEGAIFGDHWQPLSPQYAAWKAKNFPGKGLLERTGNMRKGFRKRIGGQDLEITNPYPYASMHQTGGDILPQRKVINMGGDIENKIVRYFIDGVAKKIRKAFG